jgi:predicted enzyme related to lactoylglutathione lyase
MNRSVSFYRDVIGLAVTFESPEWTEFATEGATIALHASTHSDPDQNSQKQNIAGSCRPGISVYSLDDFHSRMIEKGIECVREPEDTSGIRIAQYFDPDGLVISVSEEVDDR